MADTFDMDMIGNIDTAFDVKEVYSNDTGDMETVFVPKAGVSPEIKEAGLTALRSLMAHENPDIVENTNKTGVEQASNGSFAEFYHGTDLGRADVAAEIGATIADTKNVAEILKAYSYNLTDDNNIVFIPREGQDTTRAKEILNAQFGMVPVQLGDFAEGLAPMAGEQARVIEFMSGKPAQAEDQPEQALEQGASSGEIEALAAQLNNTFFLFGPLLDAKKGVTEDQIKEAQKKLAPYFETTLVKTGERTSGLRPVPSDEPKAKVMYQIMHAVKNAQSISTLYPELIKNATVQAAVQEMNAEPDEQDETTFVLGANNGVAPGVAAAPKPTVIPTAVNTGNASGMSAPAMSVNSASRPAPTGTIPDEVDESAGAKTFADYVQEYMTYAGEDTTRTSDENEVFFDAMRYAALNQAGEKFGDLLSLKAGERSEALDRVIGSLSGKKMKEYQGHLEAGKMSVLEALPPKKLAMLSEVVGQKLSKAKEGSDEHNALTTQMANIDTRIDSIIADYVGGETIIDQNNVADAYEGMMAILATRESKNETVQRAHDMLRVTIDEYDKTNNLMGLTPKDDKALTARFDELVGKMPIGDFDIKKLGGLLKGVPIAKDVAIALTSLQFTDDKGNVIAQTNDTGEIVVGSELDLLRQVSIADAVTTLVTEKEALTPETVAYAFNGAVKNNVANLLIADLTEKGMNPTHEAVNKAFANLMQGEPHKVTQAVMTGFVAGHNNAQMGFVNRLATKVGKDSSIAKKLFAPIKGIDALAEKRFGPLYTKAKGLAKVLGGNITRSLLMGAASRIALIAGGPAAAVGVSAAMTAIRYWKLRRAEVKSAKAQDKPVPSFGSFLKRNATGMAMSTVSMTAMAVGLPIVNMAVAGANISRSVWTTFRESRKGNFTRWQSLRRAMTGMIPTAATMATMALGGEYMNDVAQNVTNMFTDTPDHLPDAAPTPTQVNPVNISEQDLANNVLKGTPIPGVPQDTVTNEPIKTVNLEDVYTKQQWEQSFKEMKEINGNEEGWTTPWAKTLAIAERSDEVDAATRLAVDKEYGVIDPSTGNLVTPHSLINDMLQGKPVNADLANQVLDKVDAKIPDAPLQQVTNTTSQTPTMVQENIPVAEEVPETADSMRTAANPQTGAVGAEIVGDAPLVHHAYSQEAHDLAHARLHGEGVYDATGHHAVPQSFNDTQLNNALASVKEVAFGHPELQGADGQSNAEILLYKLVQVDKLTGADMDLQNGHEVGEHFGVKDSGGHLHTPQSLLKDLMSGKPVDAEVAAQILGKVENGVSAEGHFLEDIKNFNEKGTWSYRPGGHPGWAEAHDTPAPAPTPVPTPTPVPVPPVPTPTPTPTAVILPEPGNTTVSPDNMLYFIPADELWKAPVLQDRIGSLPKKKQVEAQKEDKVATPQTPGMVDKSSKGDTNKANTVPASQTVGTANNKVANPKSGQTNTAPKPSVDVSFNGKVAGSNGAFTFKMGDNAPDKRSAVDMINKLRDDKVDGKPEAPKVAAPKGTKDVDPAIIAQLHSHKGGNR